MYLLQERHREGHSPPSFLKCISERKDEKSSKSSRDKYLWENQTHEVQEPEKHTVKQLSLTNENINYIEMES